MENLSYFLEFKPPLSFLFVCFPLKAAEVWGFEMGKQLFEFTDAHRAAAITCLTFDSSGRSYVSFLYRLYLCKHYCWCLQQGMLLLSPVLGWLQEIEMDA